jgi:arylsulfatase K
MEDVVPIPNIRELINQGVFFDETYSNSPVCCPSRASFVSGKHAHKIKHVKSDYRNYSVNGAWNNFEGVDKDYDQTLFDLMAKLGGYQVHLSGKRDWTEGSHSLNIMLGSWTMYTKFPYDSHLTGGWNDQGNTCRSNGTVLPGNQSAHSGDWNFIRESLSWVENHISNNSNQPFMTYIGTQIAHPPYVTNDFWFNKIDPDRISVPDWDSLEDMHPCDFQSVMLKGCIPPDDQKEWFYSKERRRRIRRIYYAMIAEFDAMVGEYVERLKQLDVLKDTVFVIISDHGDMNMEHQQFYKTSPFEASVRVPMIFSWPGNRDYLQSALQMRRPTQLLDLFPTFLDIAKVERSRWPTYLDGDSLFPGLNGGSFDNSSRVILSQFHGNENAMSWYMIRYNNWKYIKYGTGSEVPAKLYDLESDPLESNDLLKHVDHTLIAELDNMLYNLVDPKSVSLDVAKYNKHMFKEWITSSNISWIIRAADESLRWHKSWMYDPEQSVEAINIWLESPETPLPACRHDFVYNVSAVI